jgi:HEPN domain-containing protein
MRKPVSPLVKEWLAKAKSDLQYAQASFKEFDSFYSQICILCHDSAEKYFKAYLCFTGVDFPKTHDLVVLSKICAAVKSFNRLGLCAVELNGYYIPLKYPSHYPPIKREQASQAIESAKAIEKFVVGKLRLKSLLKSL